MVRPHRVPVSVDIVDGQICVLRQGAKAIDERCRGQCRGGGQQASEDKVGCFDFHIFEVLLLCLSKVI